MTEPTDKSLDELANEYDRDRWARGAWAAGLVIYASGLLYGLYRNLHLFGASFAQTEYQVAGYLAVVMLAFNAVALPIFIHFRASGLQYLCALCFYAFDLVVYAANAIIDFRIVQGFGLGELGTFYYENIAFATPILVMASWAILMVLDPHSQLRRALVEAQGDMTERLAKSFRGAIRRQSVGDTLSQQAMSWVDLRSEHLLPSANGAKPVTAVKPGGRKADDSRPLSSS